MADYCETVSDAAVYMTPSSASIVSNTQFMENFDSIIDELDHQDYISILFLLMDYITPDVFLNHVKLEKNVLKMEFDVLWRSKGFNEQMMVEILGTLKKYKLLKKLGTCRHLFSLRCETFSQVDEMWKFLYSLCEEFTDEELATMKQELFKNESSSFEINSAEELFCHAYVTKVFHRNELTKLCAAFEKVKPDCLSKITSFSEKTNVLKVYAIRESTRTHHCGIALIINHVTFYKENGSIDEVLKERNGTRIDVEKLRKMWESFGFKTEIAETLTDVQVIDKFRALSKLDHSDFDAFVMCYLSHGDKDVVYASNSKAVRLEDLISVMCNECPTLINKPKLFFIQACQGTQIQQGVKYPVTVDVETPLMADCGKSPSSNPPKNSDYLKVVATVPGYVSFRDDNGSWLMRSIVKWMDQYGDKEDIETILIRVKDEVASQTGKYGMFENCKQMPLSESTLRRRVIFKKRQL